MISMNTFTALAGMLISYIFNNQYYSIADMIVSTLLRTARVGNSGLATTFFNDRNMPIASDLTKVLQENKQEIPKFLKDYMSNDL
jgi:ATP-dependent RNA helicase DDX3X